MILSLTGVLLATDIPLRIVSGVNSRSFDRPIPLAKGTILWLDRYDFNTALWIKKGLIHTENDIQMIYKSSEGKEEILPRTITGFGSIPNRNRLFFKLQETLFPLSESRDYYLRLIPHNKRKEKRLEEVLVYRDFLEVSTRNIIFENLEVGKSKTVRIEFKLNVLEVIPKSLTLAIIRGYWLGGNGKIIGKFLKCINPNPSGFFKVVWQKDIPEGAKYLKVDIGLPKGTHGKLQIKDLFILKGNLPNINCWQPRVEIIHQRFYPKLQIYTHKGTVVINEKYLREVRITRSITKISCQSWMNKFIKLNDEGFILQIDPTRLILVAKDKRGLLYGKGYLNQLKGRRIPSQIIADWPENRYRLLHVIVWLSGVENFVSKLDRYIKLCHENRLNGILLQSSAYWRRGEGKFADALKEIHQKIKSANLELIPLCWNFRDPIPCKDISESFNLSAGKWVKNEIYKLTNSPVFLKPKHDAYPMGKKTQNGYYPIVLLTESSRFLLRTLSDGRVLKEGKDYKLIGGWENGRYSPMMFCRLPSASVPEGTVVFASYNYLASIKGANRYWRQTCLSEPRAYDYVENSAKIVARELQPSFYHIGADEIITINRDSRDITRDLPTDAIYAEYITKIYNIIKRYSPSANVIIWADAVNKYHTRGWVSSRYPELPEKLVERIPKDIIVVPWSEDYLDRHKIIDWFGKIGFRFWAGGGYLSVDKSIRWARELSIARERNYQADGYIFTEWYAGDYLSLPEVSPYIWSSPPYYRIVNQHTVCIYDPLSLIKHTNLQNQNSTDNFDEINIDIDYYRIHSNCKYIEAKDHFGFISKLEFK